MSLRHATNAKQIDARPTNTFSKKCDYKRIKPPAESLLLGLPPPAPSFAPAPVPPSAVSLAPSLTPSPCRAACACCSCCVSAASASGTC